MSDFSKQFAPYNVTIAPNTIEEGTPICRGYDFNQGVDFDKLMQSYLTTGFQATNLGMAVEEINKMLNWRMSPEEAERQVAAGKLDCVEDGEKARTKIFLGFTSNMISCGMREIIRYLVQHKLVDAIVTTAGAIEEDFMKCRTPTYMGDFDLKGTVLRSKGLNRIGNLIVPNDNYIQFEAWITPILDQMHQEQVSNGTIWTPSMMIDRLGKEIDNEDSVCYWCHKNNIPIFSPALTDGSLGDVIYFHSYNCDPKLILDIAGDVRRINDLAINNTFRSGMIILGGGVIKHHICNANLMRNGADYSVFINTGQPFDGSDTGASPDEAVSWGKIRAECRPVKVWAEASLVFPLIVSQTFVKYHQSQQAAAQSSQ